MCRKDGSVLKIMLNVKGIEGYIDKLNTNKLLQFILNVT